MKITAVSLLLLDVSQFANGFSFNVGSPKAAAKAQGPVQLQDWNNQVSEPPAQEGRRYGPNWTIDPDTLGPKKVENKCGAMVWAMSNSTCTFPEQRTDFPVGSWIQTRPKLGICMSGGGQRAATCALGWYRALVHLDLLTKARYLASNSGGTWTTLPLFTRQMLEKKDDNADMDYAEFVGKYQEPEDIVFGEDPYGFIGKVLEQSDMGDYKIDEEKANSFSAWCDGIDREYVEPVMKDWNQDKDWKNDFWLELSDSYLWNTPGKKDMLNKNSFPFPIFVATVYDERNKNEFFPLENTPLYSGIPMDPRGVGIDTDFGGGFVQGVALNSKGLEDSSPVSPDPENINFKEFDIPSPVVKVSELTGASSQAAASGDAMTKIDLANPLMRGVIKMFFPLINRFMDLNIKGGSDSVSYFDPAQYKWWSPTTGGDPVNFSFVDGMMYDNLGALAVLRRGMSTVILCVACSNNLLKTDDGDLPETFDDIAQLFGAMKPNLAKRLIYKKSYVETLNERSQVFEKQEFMILMKEMKDLQSKGKPLVVRKKLKLIPNKYAGIFESREVDMIFCFNGEVKEFDDRAEEPESLSNGFPYLGTLKFQFSTEEVNRLSSLSSYNLVEGLNNVNFEIDQVERLSP